MSKSYKLSGDGNYIDSAGVVYNKTLLSTVVGGSIKNITRNGTTFTATKNDGTTFTFTQQDNDTDTKPNGVVLYNNASGSTGSITLSQNYTNFTKFQIECSVNHGSIMKWNEIITNYDASQITGLIGFSVKDPSQNVVFYGGGQYYITTNIMRRAGAYESRNFQGPTQTFNIDIPIYKIIGYKY